MKDSETELNRSNMAVQRFKNANGEWESLEVAQVEEVVELHNS